MKVRPGFVSNSSSSSFVVMRSKDVWVNEKEKEKILTREHEKLLKKNGFSLQLCYFPHQVDTGRKLSAKEIKNADWGKSVVCNQDCEIEFLLKNRINFVADIHYEHYTMIYDGNSDVLLIAQNYGKQAQMCGDNKTNFKPWCKQGVEKITGETYLKNHKT
jgi:hypothetical protein